VSLLRVQGLCEAVSLHPYGLYLSQGKFSILNPFLNLFISNVGVPGT
jgi:hypothetical protein